MDTMMDARRGGPVDGRKKLHLRRISCEGFEREDGLIDIEGTLVDEKPFPLQMKERSLQAHEPIHWMRLCLSIDRQFRIHAVQAQMRHSPYGLCPEVVPRYQALVGLRIEPGFTRRVKQLFQGIAGCSHMTELLPSIATTAFQILWNESDHSAPAEHGHSAVDGCASLRLDGEVVRMHFPHLLRR
ncbi:hypothetical protein D3C78_1263980 [compost metagenome]